MTNDSTIKLFGRTIFQTHNTDVTTNDYSSEFSPPLAHEDFSDHSLHSSLSSSSPLEVNSSHEHDSKRYKVCVNQNFHHFGDKILVAVLTTFFARKIYKVFGFHDD